RATVLAYGGLDILVCSAGLATSAPLTQNTLGECESKHAVLARGHFLSAREDWERNYAVLARGYFLPAREAFRVLLQQDAGGSIVFVGSKNALVAGANAAAY